MQRAGRTCGPDIYGDVFQWPQTYPSHLQRISCMTSAGKYQCSPAKTALLPKSPHLTIKGQSSPVLSNKTLLAYTHHDGVFTCFWLWGLWCDQLSSAYQPPAQGSEPPRGLTRRNAQGSALCQAQKAEETAQRSTLHRTLHTNEWNAVCLTNKTKTDRSWSVNNKNMQM